MRKVNQAYGLPDPPMWYQTLFKSTIAAMVKLVKNVMHYKKEPVRVRNKSPNCADRLDLTTVHSNRLWRLRKSPHQTSGIPGP